MSSAAAIPQPVSIVIPPNITVILGPQLLGIFFNWGLLGVLGAQVYVYYLSFPTDARHIRILVYGLFVIEIIQTCMVSSDGWNWLIAAWGHPEQLEAYHLAWFDVPVMAGLTAMTVQLFFAWRIWKLGKSLILAGVVAAVSITQGVAAVASGIQLRLLPSFAEVGKLFPTVSVWLGGSALSDIIIAIAMIYLLTRAKSNFQQTNYFLARLVRLTVETGSLTAVVATVDLILFIAFRDNNLHICPAIILAKLYTNTLLAVFNNRIFMPRSNPLAASGTGSGSGGRNGPEPSDYYRSRISPHAISQSGSKIRDGQPSFLDGFKESDGSTDIALGPISHYQGSNASASERGEFKGPIIMVETETTYV